MTFLQKSTHIQKCARLNFVFHTTSVYSPAYISPPSLFGNGTVSNISTQRFSLSFRTDICPRGFAQCPPPNSYRWSLPLSWITRDGEDDRSANTCSRSELFVSHGGWKSLWRVPELSRCRKWETPRHHRDTCRSQYGSR